MTKVHIEGSTLGFNIVIQRHVVMIGHGSWIAELQRTAVQADDGTAPTGGGWRNEPCDRVLGLVSAHDFVAGALAVFRLLAYALTYG